MRAARWFPLLAFLLIAGGTIWFQLSRTSGRFPDFVQGTARDNAGPVAEARVRFQAGAEFVTTDASGRFRLPRKSSAARVTAAKVGYLIAGAAADRSPFDLRLTRLPAEDNETYAWVDPTPQAGTRNCGTCHAEIYQEWQASGHAHSANGKHFRNLYDGADWHGRPNRGWSLLAEHPDGAGVCAACHAPTAAPLAELRELQGVAALGVHCDFCHKIESVGDGELGLTHGRFNLNLRRPSQGQLFFGSLDDVDRGEDSYSPLYKESRYCASCHEGVVFGVHVYSTFSEWQESPARREGKQCQTCHMKATGKLTNIAPDHGGIERDSQTLANHAFLAGSREEMLRACLHLDVRTAREKDQVSVKVTLEARDVGHRVPTGFVDRNLVLTLAARDAEGKAVPPRSGPKLSGLAGGQLAGQPGRLYAKQLRGFDGRQPAPFWRSDNTTDDSRLKPGEPDRSVFSFATETSFVTVRVVYRRFWPEVAAEKGWPDHEIVVAERVVSCARAGR
jgi:hypothetical protein